MHEKVPALLTIGELALPSLQELDEAAADAFEYTKAYLPVNRLLDGTVHDW